MAALALRSSTQLEISATAAEVRSASEWVFRMGRAFNVPQEQLDRLDICLNEALANVIAHNTMGPAPRSVELKMDIRGDPDAGEAALTLLDDGPAFDVVAATLPQRASRLSEAEPGGLGLLMMRSFSDALSYQRVGARNELRFCVRWA